MNAQLTADALAHLIECKAQYDGLARLVESGKLPDAMRESVGIEVLFSRAPPPLPDSDVMRELKVPVLVFSGKMYTYVAVIQGKFRATKDRAEEELSSACAQAVVVTASALAILSPVPGTYALPVQQQGTDRGIVQSDMANILFIFPTSWQPFLHQLRHHTSLRSAKG